jgi:hypothetical protein
LEGHGRLQFCGCLHVLHGHPQLSTSVKMAYGKEAFSLFFRDYTREVLSSFLFVVLLIKMDVHDLHVLSHIVFENDGSLLKYIYQLECKDLYLRNL